MPPIRWASAPSHEIAYQIVGDGPIDVIFVQGYWSNLELMWEDPRISSFLTRMGSFCRLIVFDRRGTGLSDPVDVARPATLDERVEDVRAVMEATDSGHPALFAVGVGAFVGTYLAAMHPELISRLAVYNTTARVRRADDYPIGVPDRLIDAALDSLGGSWGREMASDPWYAKRATAWESRYRRQSMSPAAAVVAQRLNYDTDLRELLPLVHVPTLVVHERDNPNLRLPHGEYLAAHIPDARLAVIEGSDDTWYFGETEQLVELVEEFLTGQRTHAVADAVLATVLFTDIVSSTEQSVALGDRQWHHLLDRHDAVSRQVVTSFGGRVVKTTGDGIVAVFDSATRALECADLLVHDLADIGLETRVGVHAGECELRGDDITGIAVTIASRIEGAAEPGQVLVSNTVHDLVMGSRLQFGESRSRPLKGVPGTWTLWPLSRSAALPW